MTNTKRLDNKTNIRKRIFEIIEVAHKDDKASKIYDITMILAICIGMIPLMTKSKNTFFIIIDQIVALLFTIDYVLRWITADFKIKKSWKSFVLFPFTFMAIVDLLCILPTFIYLDDTFKIVRFFRVVVGFRAFKVITYSRSLKIIINVIKNHRKPILMVFGFAFTYIFIAALTVFNVEPDTFTNFFDALYWATMSLATVGYGDIVPLSIAGKFFTMLSSLVGIAIIALPSGIITAAYLTEYNKETGENVSTSV